MYRKYKTEYCNAKSSLQIKENMFTFNKLHISNIVKILKFRPNITIQNLWNSAKSWGKFVQNLFKASGQLTGHEFERELMWGH